jgi:hypothetical protein
MKCMRFVLVILGVGLIWPVRAQFVNQKLTIPQATDKKPVRVSIAIQSKMPANAIIAVSPNHVFRTEDGGLNWIDQQVESPLGTGLENAAISDLKGHLFFFHTANAPPKGNGLDHIVVQKSTDGGKTWSAGAVLGENEAKDERAVGVAVHPRRPIVYATWSEFDQYLLNDQNCHSNILYSMSTNGGGKWTKPVQITQTPGDCRGEDNTAEGAMPAIAADGRIFVTWANQGVIFFDRSYDGGEMWLSNDIGIAKQMAGWSLNIPGHGATSGKPMIGIDNGQGRSHGSLYVTYADQAETNEDTDIWFLRSTNRGDTWTRPVRINGDESRKHQYMPAMAVDEVTGNIFVVYYDRRNYDDLQTDVYLGYSLDAGNTFREVKISETPFVPDPSIPLGMPAISAFDGLIMPVWSRVDQGAVTIMTTVIKQEQLRKK